LANNYFQFKQFRIDQENAAMKVCTDSCIFGAVIKPTGFKKILDIGTGTGLLALMIAQRSDASIDAVEIDKEAAEQAKQNVKNSPWSDKIKVYKQPIQEFTVTTENKYDLIISNPPFYKDSLKSEDEKINTAHHSTFLSMEELLDAVSKLLLPQGLFMVLLPSFEAELLREAALEHNLFTSSIVKIKDNEKAKVLREITVFSYTLTIPSMREFVIKKEDNSYTVEFVELLKEYYLNL
jgi:tRNA1Val (adenine37-N6)-methyltransferase